MLYKLLVGVISQYQLRIPLAGTMLVVQHKDVTTQAAEDSDVGACIILAAMPCSHWPGFC